ncbi:hypothetical protein Moror_6958 [Moniliophthora roreri MCA 2997]|uniref:Uncharacterized protein n=1 Tax=Moniliophthora roreri (strain MCA 2997) TaxID=1381753 RepID=V2XV56_MONRO|nr:hypothetical protein Moror_6958 [Moniliophthora roreri MCA 2997]
MRGLVAYDDDSEDDEPAQQENGSKFKSSKELAKDESRHSAIAKIQKSHVIIKKPRTAHPHTRTNISEDIQDSPKPSTSQSRSSPELEIGFKPGPSSNTDTPSEAEELTRIRSMLRPPPIPGLVDWGIPSEEPEGERESCDPAIEVHFFTLTFILQLMGLSERKNSVNFIFLSTLIHQDISTTPSCPIVHFEILIYMPNWLNSLTWTRGRRISQKRCGIPTPNIQVQVDGMRRKLHSDVASYQKSRSEQQAKEKDKRSHIDFTSSSSASGREKEKGRYNPYSSGGGHRIPAHGKSDRGRLRWGK